jgi:hypothetical protein
LGKQTCIINDNRDSEGKYPREVNMVNQVVAVKAAVASKTPLSLFDNPQMKEYLCKLDPKHSPPYHLEQTRILEVMMDSAMKELVQMLTECREHLHEGLYQEQLISGQTFIVVSNTACL